MPAFAGMTVRSDFAVGHAKARPLWIPGSRKCAPRNDGVSASVLGDQFTFPALRTKAASSALKRGASSKNGECPTPW